MFHDGVCRWQSNHHCSALMGSLDSSQRRYEDEEVAAAVLELVKTTLELAGERMALASAQAFTASLQDKADVAARIQAAVRDKHARIVNFEREIVSGGIAIIFILFI